MILVNLIPAPRRHAKVQRRRLRFWAARLGVYFLVLAVLCFVRMSHSSGPSEALASQGRQLTAAIGSRTQAYQLLQAQLASAKDRVQSLHLVGTQPDWSLLLRLVADQMGENVVMDNCSLRHVAGTGTDVERNRQSLVMDISGIGRTEKDVSEFVLKLEKCGLFAEVKHVNASGRTFHEKKAFGFQLKCRLAGAQEELRK